MMEAPNYRNFTLPKGKRRRKTEQDQLYTNTRLRLAMTLEARELGLNLTDYLELIGYELAQTRMDPQGDELLEKSLFFCEEPSENDEQDD